MKTRRQHATEEALTISRRSTPSPISIGNSETIPIDLIFEIFSRLPSKSIAKCRCVSKFWDSTLRRTDFTELFITRSRARPQLLLSCVENEELFLFSIPQVQNQDAVTANYEEHQVLTLGTKKKMSWRKIECSISHYFLHITHGICINGVVYYVAGVNGPPMANCIVCFDVRSEKFKVINRAEEMALWSQSTLVDYKGKLGALLSEGFTEVTGETKCFELWVLVDAGKHEWSKHISILLPLLWKNIVADATLFFVGVTGTDEIVLSPHYVSYLSEPYCFHVY